MIYSLEERKIGSWLDKPLYQKTIAIPTATYPSGTSYIDLTDDLPVDDIDKVIDYNEVKYYNDYSTSEPMVDISSTALIVDESFVKIGVYISNARSYSADIYVTLRYTKKSDTV